MEIWIPVGIEPITVHKEIQDWLDKYSQHAYKSIIQDRINSRYPTISNPRALYILTLDSRKVLDIKPHEHNLVNNTIPEAVLCPICHETDTVVRQTLQCNHRFHVHCIQRWFRVNNTCPLCRLTINF